METLFSDLEPLLPDPIFGLVEAYRNDPREKKINLGVGAYRSSEGNPWVLPSVRKVEKLLLEKQLDKEYLPISGDPLFVQEASQLVLPTGWESGCHVQTVGGSSALRTGADLLFQQLGPRKVLISDPTWPNHLGIFSAAGHVVSTYPYFDRENKVLRFAEWMKTLSTAEAKDVVVLHVGCHNPTGIDPTKEQWEELAYVIKKQGLIPFFDMAYLGFGGPLDMDRGPLELFLQNEIPFFLATSFSKNFGLYGERVGLLSLVPGDSILLEYVKRQIRSTYSTPPCHGARLVGLILSNLELRHEWLEDLQTMRARILHMRSLFAKKLSAALEIGTAFLVQQKGMFSYLDLTPEQVAFLAENYAIYLPSSGRINVAGLTETTLDYVVEAIDEAKKQK